MINFTTTKKKQFIKHINLTTKRVLVKQKKIKKLIIKITNKKEKKIYNK